LIPFHKKCSGKGRKLEDEGKGERLERRKRGERGDVFSL